MTEAVKHTPGPWFFDGPSENLIVWEWNNADNRICFMTSDGPARANAHLIAAAPDLLEVATLFASSLEYLIALDRKKGDDEGASMKGITLNVVRAAIARAEGRS